MERISKLEAKKVWKAIFTKRCYSCKQTFPQEDLFLIKKDKVIKYNINLMKNRKEKIILEITKDFWLCENCYETWEPKFCDRIRYKRGVEICYSSEGCKVWVYEDGKLSTNYFIPKNQIKD